MKDYSQKCERIKKQISELKKKYPIELNEVLMFPGRKSLCTALVKNGYLTLEDIKKIIPKNTGYHIDFILERRIITLTHSSDETYFLTEPYKSFLTRQVELETTPEKTIEEILEKEKCNA